MQKNIDEGLKKKGAQKSKSELFNIDNFILDQHTNTLSFFSESKNTSINQTLIKNIKSISDDSSEKNVRLCMHSSPGNLFHNMVILEHKKNHYYQPHYHSDKQETLHIIEGEAHIICFDEDGALLNSYLLSHDVDVIVRIDAGVIHTVIPKSSRVIYHESKLGPFEKGTSSIFPSWSSGTDEGSLANRSIKQVVGQKPLVILITGSGGFIGKILTQLFAANGATVIAGYFKNEPSFEKVDGDGLIIPCFLDIREPIKIPHSSIDIIIHTAAGSHIDHSFTDLEYINTNLKGTLNIANFANEQAVKSVIFLSSVSLYGKVNDSILTEKTPINEANMYGVSKYMGEKLLSECKHSYSLLCLRLPGVVDKDYFRSWLGQVFLKLQKHKPVSIYNPESDFNNITTPYEIYNFISHVIKLGLSGDRIINFAASNPIKLNEVVQIMLDELDSRSEVNIINSEQSSFVISTEKMTSIFNFQTSDTVKLVKKYCKDNI